MSNWAGGRRPLSPREVCSHDPCWCGQPIRHGFDPYDAEKADAWLAEREAARSALRGRDKR